MATCPRRNTIAGFHANFADVFQVLLRRGGCLKLRRNCHGGFDNAIGALQPRRATSVATLARQMHAGKLTSVAAKLLAAGAVIPGKIQAP
ncbi:MAG TPA: hypothetical protein VFN13_06510 [Rudaea sp.]|nr:hypothetical protein [Rudaea sp.]